MGQYGEQIARATTAKAQAEAEYADAVRSMAGAAPNVRAFVLNEIRGRIDEAQWMIDTFTNAGR